MEHVLIGNERVQNNIGKMIKSGMLPHAVLLCGENGLGKKTLARFLAKACLCNSQQKPCLKCKNCHLAEVGSHPDLLVVAPEQSTIKVEQIRFLRNEAYVSPMMADSRVFIIEAADTMNQNAQNALLKVLEEPPANVYFILLARNLQSLLPTVLSRCVCFNLSPVSVDEEGFELLQKKYGMSVEQSRNLLAVADGNIGEAIELSKGNNVIFSDIANKIIILSAKSDRLGILKTIQPFVNKRNDFSLLVKELKNAVIREIKKRVVNEYSTFSYSRLKRIYDALTDIENAFEYNPSMALVACRIADVLA